MNSDAFLSAVKEEIARLQQIQNLLEHGSSSVTPGSAAKPASGKRGGMSDAGKARVAEAQRKRWAAIKAAAAAESAPAKKQASATVKTSAKTLAGVRPAKKQKASTSKPVVGKTAAAVKKATVKKLAAATKPAVTKKAPATKRNSAGQAAPKKQTRKQLDLKARDEAPEANAAVPDALPSATENTSSNE